MPAGRPSSYDPAICKKVDEYLEMKKDEYQAILKARNTESGHEAYDQILKVDLPMVEDFAVYVGVPLSTLYHWRETHPEFLEALGRIAEEQKKRLLNKGLSGEYNSTIAKLILSANHGMSEKTINTNIEVKADNKEEKAREFLKEQGLI
jgi:reverse gyrase